MEIKLVPKSKLPLDRKSNLSLARRKGERELKNLLFEVNYDKHHGAGIARTSNEDHDMEHWGLVLYQREEP